MIREFDYVEDVSFGISYGTTGRVGITDEGLALLTYHRVTFAVGHYLFHILFGGSCAE